MNDYWHEILDQGIIAAFMGGVIVLIVTIYGYFKSLFNKKNDSDIVKSGNISFLDKLEYKWNQITDIFLSKPSDKISKAFQTVMINAPLDNNGVFDEERYDEIQLVSIIEFKKHYSAIYNLLDEKCDFKDYTWRSAFKARLSFMKMKTQASTLSKKERDNFWLEIENEFEERYDLNLGDYEDLEDRIKKYRDTNQFSWDLYLNYESAVFTQNKFL